MRRKVAAAKSICTCFDILEQRERGDESGQYEAALATLRENKIGTDGAAREKFRAELSEAEKQAAELKEQVRGIREKIIRTEEARGVSKHVDVDDPIIASKKGGKHLDR